jgi:hypothetical protein
MRQHWESVADTLLESAWRWATPRGALLDLPGPPSASGVRSDGLEGYARTFLAAAFRVAGSGEDPYGLVPRYASGLVAGTLAPGRDDEESWPVILGHDVFGQPMVESASIALGLRLTRPWLWDNLSGDAQDRVESWLRGALRHVPAPNNWYLFPFTVAGFLESAGRGDAETARVRERALELLETWYRGDGWYSDGDGQAFDHYNGWALHLYPVLDAYLGSADNALFGERLRTHLESFASLFGSDGAPLHFGRSLTYRFAAASAVALGAVTGYTPLAPGASRRLLNRALEYFLDHGALNSDGLLSLGWHGSHPPTLQRYSGPASPYWAAKAFVCLLAAEDHPLWTASEEPIPAEGPDSLSAVPAAGFLIQSAGGIVRLHNHGSDNVKPHEGDCAPADPHYSRFAYSTHSGPTSSDNISDNHFCVVVNGIRSARRRIHPLGSGPDWAASWHRPVFASGAPQVPGLRVESVTVGRGPWELRVHRVLGAPAGAHVEQTGWATELPSALFPLHGWTTQDQVRAPQGTAFVSWALIPRLAGTSGLCASVAVLGAEPDSAPASVVAVSSTSLTVRWADETLTAVDFDPLTVSSPATE